MFLLADCGDEFLEIERFEVFVLRTAFAYPSLVPTCPWNGQFYGQPFCFVPTCP